MTLNLRVHTNEKEEGDSLTVNAQLERRRINKPRTI